MAAADKFKKTRSHVIAPTTAEKETALDTLFASLPTAAPKSGVKKTALPTVLRPAGSVEIFSTFGFGSIVIDGKDTKLPYIVSNPTELMSLKAVYQIDKPGSYLKTRRIGG